MPPSRSPGNSSSPARRVLQHKHHLEQRRAAQVPLRLQLFHQLLERHVLMRIRPRHTSRTRRSNSPKRRLAPDLRAQRPACSRRTRSVLPSPARCVRRRRPDHDVCLPAVAIQQRLKRRQQRHEQRHSLAAAQFAVTARHSSAEMEAMLRAADNSAPPAARRRSAIPTPSRRRPTARASSRVALQRLTLQPSRCHTAKSAYCTAGSGKAIFAAGASLIKRRHFSNKYAQLTSRH